MSKANLIKRSKKSLQLSKNIPARNDSQAKHASNAEHSSAGWCSDSGRLASREILLSPFARRFIKCIQNTVKKFELWGKGDSFIVGVSGGPDSVCLLDVLFFLSQKYDFKLYVAHINYHLRGKESDLDEKLVREMAAHYNFPCFVFSQRKKMASGAEEALRDVRYAFFEKVRKKVGAHHIAVAHNQNDQAETLLMRLLRGAGLSGLSAMRSKNGYIIRPLIETSRADIIQYLSTRRLVFREDKSNKDERYFRNRIRHTLIPFLEKNFQPQTVKLFSETALLLGEDYALLEKQSFAFSVKHDFSGAEFSRSAILNLFPVLLRCELRALLKPLLSGKNPEKNLVNELIKALKSEKSKIQTITLKGLKFVRKGDKVRLFRLH
jgi:tRNA(Ile)-lysidine synthetase-like protein